MRRSVRKTRGFTLIEAIASIVVLAVVASTSTSVVWAAVHSFEQGAETARLQSEASIAMERMIRDLRAVSLIGTDTGTNTPDISSVTAGSITWNGSTRSLALSGSDLVLTVNGTGRVLLEGVTAFSVQAYNGANTAMATTLSGSACDPIRRLSLQVDVARGEASSSVRTKVFLRCMMLEGV